MSDPYFKKGTKYKRESIQAKAPKSENEPQHKKGTSPMIDPNDTRET